MAISTYTVYGAAFVYVNPAGAGYSLLGYTEQGVDIDITESKDELMTDLLGTKTPQDFQDMGGLVRIVAPLIAVDTTVLDSIFMVGDLSSLGQINTPGVVLGINNKAVGIGIASPSSGGAGFNRPWTCPTAIIRSHGSRIATKANPWRLEAVGWPFLSFTASSGKGGVLFKRSLP
jgi:hypothetical protein